MMLRATRLMLLAMASFGPTPAFATTPSVNPNCAIRVRVEGQVIDSAGKPVVGAQLWHVDSLGGVVPADQAWLVGASDAMGNLDVDVCYLGEIMYCAKPPTGAVGIEFFVLKDGLGVGRIKQSIPAHRLVKEGLSVVGEPCKGPTKSFRIGEGGVRGYPLKVKVVLQSMQVSK